MEIVVRDRGKDDLVYNYHGGIWKNGGRAPETFSYSSLLVTLKNAWLLVCSY
jgi:hypothetical protein